MRYAYIPSLIGPAKTSEPTDTTATSPTHSPSPSPRRKKKRPELPLDENGEPVQELDPKVATMAELCVDFGIGRPSSRTEMSVTKAVEWKDKQRVLRQQVKERIKRKHQRLADGEEEDDDGARKEKDGEAEMDVDVEVSAATKRLNASVAPGGSSTTADGPPSPQLPPDISLLTSRTYGPRARIDHLTGDIVMDDLSLQIDRFEAARLENPHENYTIVEEAETDRFVNSATWSRKLSGTRWTREETDLWYQVSFPVSRRAGRTRADGDGGSITACSEPTSNVLRI